MPSKTILIVDDDIQIGNLEQEILIQSGYSCIRAYSGTEAAMLLERARPDLILLDLMLPGLPGEALLGRIRGIPVIVVSAKVDIDDKVSLLLGGAADYITKPFNARELLARIEVQLRRVDSDACEIYRHGGILLDASRHAVTAGDDVPVSLTKTEYAILKLLMRNPGQVIPKSVILDRISEDTPDCTESSLKTHISHLRSKLRQVSGTDCIESVWGVGFKMAE